MSNWQEDLDDRFPFGAAVTQVEDVPEGVGFDDSVDFLTPRIEVVEDDETHPTVQVGVVGMDKSVVFKLGKLEEFAPGAWLVHTLDDDHNYLLSTNVSEETKAMLINERKEAYG